MISERNQWLAAGLAVLAIAVLAGLDAAGVLHGKAQIKEVR